MLAPLIPLTAFIIDILGSQYFESGSKDKFAFIPTPRRLHNCNLVIKFLEKTGAVKKVATPMPLSPSHKTHSSLTRIAVLSCLNMRPLRVS